ncbi:MAG: phosphate ABC transporter permease PstA [Nitrospinae bacterium]|nr:phosphate ABC transporter permease PstA [Nitrospinota bacterium]
MKAKDPKQKKEKKEPEILIREGDSGNHNEPPPEVAQAAEVETSPPGRTGLRASIDFKARGEPFVWIMGGALALGVLMIIGFLALVLWNGIVTFYPGPVEVVTLKNGQRIAGEPFRSESFRPSPEQMKRLDPETRRIIREADGFAHRTLYRIGNFDVYNEDFKWAVAHQVAKTETPPGIFFIERREWGPFIGFIKTLTLDGRRIPGEKVSLDALYVAHDDAVDRREAIRSIEVDEIGAINYYIEEDRLALRRTELDYGKKSAEYRAEMEKFERQTKERRAGFAVLKKRIAAINKEDEKYKVTLSEIGGREKRLRLSEIVRIYPANNLSFFGKIGVYFSRWGEFLTDDPREANTEGGVLPAIFGTIMMTLLMVVFVAPFGVITALYLREYAKEGALVSIVRICVNNLAGVPSIVYGVFGLGFFAYTIGVGIDQLFYPERLPNPTFGTGGLLWASLTLALLTVPVVIVATEEALTAVPRSMREGSLACGASKWQTIRNIVLPQAMPGIMTGLILAMARGAGEVAPLMLVGVVKLAPELPFDTFFPFLHPERSFMHLGFHIYDVGFQSRNSEAGKPMVFVTTLLLITIIALMNAFAIMIRNRLRRKFVEGQF